MCLSSVRRVSALCIWLAVSILAAQQLPNTAVPNLIRYGGTLKDGQGAPLASSTVGITFAIYNQQDGGAGIWMETQNVTTDAAGNYSVVLGSTTATGLPGDLFSQQEQRWLGVQVQGQVEQPRVLLVSVPYAFRAHEAETLGGKSVSDFVLANGATSPANRGGTVQAASITNSAPVPNQVRKGAASDGPTNFSGSTTDQIVGVTQSGTGYAIAATADSKAIVGTATDPSATAYGVQGVATGTAGVGLIGTATSATGFTYGLRGTSSSTSGTGVRGIAVATSGITTGISGYVDSAAGTAGVLNNAAGGKIFSGQNNGTEMFSVDGSGNVNSTSGTYRVGGSSVLNIGNAGDDNLFLGVGAGGCNVAGSGTANVFSGNDAGYSNTTGSENVFSGQGAGISNTTGSGNTFNGNLAGFAGTTACCNVLSGYEAGFNNTASDNTFSGYQAGASNTVGAQNTFSGYQAGYNNLGDNNGYGSYNTFSGYQAGLSNTLGEENTFDGYQAGYSNLGDAIGRGSFNTFYGFQAGYLNTSGYDNTFLGFQAGYFNTSGINDVYISAFGSGTESNTIRIGADQSATYIVGIYGATSSGGIPVYINGNGQLGTLTSSRRFKEQIADMGDSSSALMKLRPVTFLYKPEYSNGERTLQYGLIAEEVAKVYPELVAYDNDRQPYSVRYQYLSTMLLNEVQKQYRRAETEAEQVAAQQQEIESLKQQLQLQNDAVQERLSRLEKLLGNQAQPLAQQ